MEAELRTRDVDRLVLYEPAFPRGGAEVIAEAVLEQIDRRIEENDVEGALTILLREAGYTDEELELLRSKPWWPVGLGAADTITRELRALNDYRFDPDRFSDFSVPTALLTGGESPPLFTDTAKTLHEGLPNSRIVTIPGQTHEAMTTAPDLFVEKVVEFVREPSPSSSGIQE
jgi:pimeloyl-ACP methyl ester carboxylesterase